MHSGWSDTAQPVPGFPIRTSPLQRSVDSSTRLIAVSHVLHRLLTPRHPPCALHNLTTSQRCSRSLCSSQGSRPAPAVCAWPDVPAGSFPRGEVSEHSPAGPKAGQGIARGRSVMRTLPENSTVCAARSSPRSPFPRHPEVAGTRRPVPRPNRIASDRP
jgi:hypothetical protein